MRLSISIPAVLSALLLCAPATAWGANLINTTSFTNSAGESCVKQSFDDGSDTISCAGTSEVEIIDVPVPPPPTTSSGDPDPVTSSGDPDPVTSSGDPDPARTTTTTDPERLSSTRRPNRTIEANKYREDSKARARKNLGYEEVPEFFGQQQRPGQDWEGLSEQIRRLGGLLAAPPKKKGPIVLPQPPENPQPEGFGEKDTAEKDQLICGPDITLVLKHFVSDLESAWHNTKTKVWDRDLGKNINPRRRACRAMAPLAPSTWTSLPGKNPKAGNAWDIQELREKKLNKVSAVCPVSPKCKNTVTVDNKCHYVGSVNYLIYGVMFRLCRSLPKIITLGSLIMTASIRAYKYEQGATNADASVAWALTGFNGWPNAKGVSTPPAEPDVRGTCQPCKDRYLRPLHWHWLGLQPSGTRPPGKRPRNLNGFDGNGYKTSEKSPTFEDWDD